MATFWSIHGTSLKRLFTGYCLIQLGISLILLYINRLTPQSALFLLVFQPIIVLCIGSASFGLRLARHTLPKLGCSPALWVGLSYVLTVLSDMPWHDPSLDPVLKWGGLGLMATLLVAFRCVWIASGRRLPLGQKVAIVGILTTFLSLGIFSLHSISHQQRTNQSQLRQELSAGLLLLGSQIEGGQQWQALMNFSPDAQIAVYSSDGSLQFYRGNEQSRRSVKELGWRLPAPSGSFLDEGKIVVWERLESGTILLARQNESGALEGLYSPLFGSLLSTAVVGLFVFGIAQDLSQQREESFEQILARLRDDHQASAYHTWDPDVQELADRLIDWAQDLRFQRDHLQTRVTSLARKTASQSRQIVTCLLYTSPSPRDS